MLRAALFLDAAMAAAVPAAAADVGSPDGAMARVKRVQEKFGKDGPDAVFRAITGKSSQPFHDRDLNAVIYALDVVWCDSVWSSSYALTNRSTGRSEGSRHRASCDAAT
jgi:hypothetical protein